MPRFVEGSFFEALPAGADAYVLKKVIHDWDDERAIAILTNCHRAMPRSGRLLLIEPIIPPDNIRSFNKLLDLLLLVWHGTGKARTDAEHRANSRGIQSGGSAGTTDRLLAEHHRGLARQLKRVPRPGGQ